LSCRLLKEDRGAKSDLKVIVLIVTTVRNMLKNEPLRKAAVGFKIENIDKLSPSIVSVALAKKKEKEFAECAKYVERNVKLRKG
tara:strand:+ start:1096 stop:1347 length:252 start_codon:yes stop_codon:yes gene_type:complete